MRRIAVAFLVVAVLLIADEQLAQPILRQPAWVHYVAATVCVVLGLAAELYSQQPKEEKPDQTSVEQLAEHENTVLQAFHALTDPNRWGTATDVYEKLNKRYDLAAIQNHIAQLEAKGRLTPKGSRQNRNGNGEEPSWQLK